MTRQSSREQDKWGKNVTFSSQVQSNLYEAVTLGEWVTDRLIQVDRWIQVWLAYKGNQGKETLSGEDPS